MLVSMNRILGTIALAVAATFAVSGHGAAADGSTAPAAAPAPVPSFAPVLRKITPAVVKVEISGRVTTTTAQRRRETREVHEVGSGVVYDAGQGLIITNHHVIDHADDITVTLTDGRVLRAAKVGADPDFDVALIRISTSR